MFHCILFYNINPNVQHDWFWTNALMHFLVLVDTYHTIPFFHPQTSFPCSDLLQTTNWLTWPMTANSSPKPNFLPATWLQPKISEKMMLTAEPEFKKIGKLHVSCITTRFHCISIASQVLIFGLQASDSWNTTFIYTHIGH